MQKQAAQGEMRDLLQARAGPAKHFEADRYILRPGYRHPVGDVPGHALVDRVNLDLLHALADA